MTVIFKMESIFNSDCQALVNPVNTVGIMGAGLAAMFKQKFPEMFAEYKVVCASNRLKIGKLHFYKKSTPIIINFPTKTHWKDKSELYYIEKGLKTFIMRFKEYKIKSVAFPMLGTGLGGLDPNDVKNLMVKYLNPINIQVDIHIHYENYQITMEMAQKLGIPE